jgi:ankyrin repeat protein
MADWDPRLTELIDAAVENPDLARKLVEADPTILDLRTGIGETALHFLAVENYGGGVQVLIDLGASVNVTNEFGATPLEEALSIKAMEAVDVLQRAGATPAA